MVDHKSEIDLKTLISLNELLINNNEIQRDTVARKQIKLGIEEYQLPGCINKR